MSTSSHTPPWAALPVLLAGAFIVVLDFFIVNVALPSMAGRLHAGPSSLEWVVAGYGLSFAVCLVLAGRCGDELGRRRLFAAGTAVFVVSSAACGIAPDATLLIVARVLQGAAGAVLMPQVLSIIGLSFRGADYGRALSAYGVVLGLAAVGGQISGGALVQLDLFGLGWRACFLINVPIGLGALAVTFRLVPESRVAQRRRVDLRGAALLALGLVCVMLPLIDGRSSGWPAWTWASLAAAPIVLVAFLHHQRRLARAGGAPLLDLTLFSRRAFSAGVVTQISIAVLFPGLLLVGAGIGLCFTPLTSIVLEHVDPDQVGAASGAMSTAQQIGYALGVAVTGLIFFGAAPQGIAHAFDLSLLQLAGLAVAVIVWSRLLPRRSSAPAEDQSRLADVSQLPLQ